MKDHQFELLMSTIAEARAELRGAISDVRRDITTLRNEQTNLLGNLIMVQTELQIIGQDVKQNSDLLTSLNRIVSGVRSLGETAYNMIASHQRQSTQEAHSLHVATSRPAPSSDTSSGSAGG